MDWREQDKNKQGFCSFWEDCQWSYTVYMGCCCWFHFFFKRQKKNMDWVAYASLPLQKKNPNKHKQLLQFNEVDWVKFKKWCVSLSIKLPKVAMATGVWKVVESQDVSKTRTHKYIHQSRYLPNELKEGGRREINGKFLYQLVSYISILYHCV